MGPTLCDDINMGNQICILVAILGDGTLLCPSSFKEDMVELCIGLGQEHPEGVLQLSATGKVLAFWCQSDIMATPHHLTAAMVWQGDPIIICILCLKGKQVREYVAMRSSHQSGTQMHVQGGSGYLAPPWHAQPGWRAVINPGIQAPGGTKQDVWDLDDDQLGEVLRFSKPKLLKRGWVPPLGSF